MILPTIYKITKTNAIVYCKISTDANIITVETGQVNTNKPTFHTTICSPKNVGRSNETSSTTQAELEAIAKHAKKIKLGYTVDKAGKSDVRLPMKVKVYQDQMNNVIFPCYVSPKLNGVNMTIRLDNTNKLTFWSRGGDSRPVLSHVEKDLTTLMVKHKLNELNVEIYKHGEWLQDIQAATTKINKLSHLLEVHIFELPCLEGTYEERLKILDNINNESKLSNIHVIPVHRNIKNHKEIYSIFKASIDQGYEGVIIRNSKGLYIHGQRSSDVFKLKETKDAEFIVESYTLDKKSHPVFTCTTKSGITFKVKPKGTDEQRLQLANNAPSLIGKWLTVEFEMLSKNGTPQKPVGLQFRNCNSKGEPLE